MRFGPVPMDGAAGAILAHSVAVADGVIRKGKILDAGDIARLRSAGHDAVTVARLDPGDVDENTAAARLAAALVPDPAAAGLSIDSAFTGRANIRATGPGVIRLDPAAIAALNGIDPMITLATVPAWQRVVDGTMVATVKIISYAVSETALQAAVARAGGVLWRCAPVLRDADLIVTEVPGADRGDKGIAAVWDRATRLGLRAGATLHVPHTEPALAAALTQCRSDLILILTGSATSDIADVAPAAIAAAGGQVTRFGMPVDPGNLLVLGTLGQRAVIGLPGCARSPALNGADWVLERIACGIAVTAQDIAAMGVGGLLKEIPTRPQPRDRRGRSAAASLSDPMR